LGFDRQRAAGLLWRCGSVARRLPLLEPSRPSGETRRWDQSHRDRYCGEV